MKSSSILHFLHTYIFIVLLILTPTGKSLTAQSVSAIHDSSAIHKYQPSTAKEKEIFSDPKLKYEHRITPEGKNFFARFLEWLSELVFGKPSYENVELMREILIWTVVVIAIVVIVWLLLKTEMVGLIRPKPKQAAFNFSDLTEELSTINFDQKIAEAFEGGNYRLAIRWQYLRMLFLLDKKQLITFSPYKTNIEYSNEIKDKDIRAAFYSLSRVYDYVWYGEFALNMATYNNNASEFEAAKKMIGV